MRHLPAAMIAIAGAAFAANGATINWYWEVTTDNGDECLDPGETATATLWAEFETPPGVAFAGSIIDFNHDGSYNGLTDAVSYDGNDLLGALSNEDGLPDGNGNILGADHFQLPKFFNPGIVEDNPIHVGTMTFGTIDFTARTVTYGTTHLNHSVYTDDFGSSDEFDAEIGDLVIKIVPAPASLALLGLGGFVGLRRRR